MSAYKLSRAERKKLRGKRLQRAVASFARIVSQRRVYVPVFEWSEADHARYAAEMRRREADPNYATNTLAQYTAAHQHLSELMEKSQ